MPVKLLADLRRARDHIDRNYREPLDLAQTLAWRDTGAMPRVYHHDHTANVRRRLVQMASYGVIGLLVASAAAGIMAISDRSGGESSAAFTAAWIADGALAAVALVYLLVTFVAWGLYRRKRADRDAAGAEAVGELRARIANIRGDNADE